MRRFQRIRITLGLALGLAISGLSVSAADTKPEVEKFGNGPAYDTLAHLAVLHEGRPKPLDTLAREEIKQIYGRETIKLLNDKGETIASWTPVAAFVDWLARPEFWDDQRFITADYIPLKTWMLTDAVKTQLAAIAGKVEGVDKAKFEPLLQADKLSEADLKGLLRSTKLEKSAAEEVEKLALRLGEGMKWVAPEEIEHAEVKHEGRSIPFTVWLTEISQKKESDRTTSEDSPKLTELERRGYDLGVKFARYRALRDSAKGLQSPWRLLPRPSNAGYIAFSGEAMNKARTEGPRSLSQLELETAVILNKYLEQIARKDWETPGKNPAFDASYAAWLKANSAWIPIAAITNTPTEELAKAGFNPAKVDAFKSGYQQLLEAERSAPGKMDPAKAVLLSDSLRALGVDSASSEYPIEANLHREVSFNRFGPFFWAPWIYLTGMVVLLLSLVVPDSRNSLLIGLRKGLYGVGMLGFVGGISLEIYGFSQRVLISGWAPVTNMYETVIWVGLVTAVIGLVLELIYRKTFAAIAASGVAMVCTMLAATVPLLDPKIAGLQPVLRSNLWLTIHVLTIVSSYAAFALSLGLGIIAMCYYLTAVYRKDASYVRLGGLLPVSLLTLALGWYVRTYTEEGQPFGQSTNLVWYVGWGVLALGLTMSIAFATAVLGEILSRRKYRRLATITVKRHSTISGGAPVATLEESQATSAPENRQEPLTESDDRRLRELAMRETAEKIKSLSSFIYRSMQVGVLLVAAGTILGGVWADYSWGRFWGWDPKEVWALITLLVYLIPLHGRFAGWVNTFGLVFASVVCFLSVLMAWYGVNFILGVGLHSYGFVEGGSQGSVTLVTSVILAFACGVWLRRAACMSNEAQAAQTVTNVPA